MGHTSNFVVAQQLGHSVAGEGPARWGREHQPSSKSPDPASPRIQQVPGSSKSPDPASPRIQQVPGSSKSPDPASPRIQQVPGSSKSPDPASPRIQQVPGSSKSPDPASPRTQQVPGSSKSPDPASPRIQQVPGDGWVFQVSCLRQHGHGGIAERHFVLKISPHSRGRYGPDEVFLVDFIPSREPCLTGPDGGQSDKLHAELR